MTALTGAEHQRNYCLRHPERTRAALYAYRRENPQRIKDIRNRCHHRDPVRKLLHLAKARAKKTGMEFTLVYADIVIPKRCPVLGMPLVPGGGGRGFKDNSPTLDRIDNSKGYIPKNVIVVSWRANRVKCDATPEELRKLADFYNGLT